MNAVVWGSTNAADNSSWSRDSSERLAVDSGGPGILTALAFLHAILGDRTSAEAANLEASGLDELVTPP